MNRKRHITILLAIAFGICLYITLTTDKKVEKMKKDLADNNLIGYIDEIKSVMEKETIITKAEEICRKDFGEI